MIVFDLNTNNAEALLRHVEEFKPNSAQVFELVTWAESLWGRIDVLANNACMAIQGEAETLSEVADMSIDMWNTSIARNLATAFLLTRAVLPGMKNRRY